MSDLEITLDPVADGRPTFDRISVVFIVILLALAAYSGYTGEWHTALTNLLFAGMIYAHQMAEQRGWESGYYAAAKSIKDQVSEYDDR